MSNLLKLKSILDFPKKIVLLVHQLPDGDALGSGLALANFFQCIGSNTTVISPTECPYFLRWMNGFDKILIADNNRIKTVYETIKQADIICCVDFSSLNRVEKLCDIIKDSTAVKIVIDHHMNPEDFGDIYLWDPKAAATAEIIFQLIVDLDKKELINMDIANCLYAAIVTDTNSFKNPNTTSKSHLIAANLIDIGVKTESIMRLLYSTNTLNKLKFLGFALSERLKIWDEYKVAGFFIKSEDLKTFDLKSGDTDILISHAMSLENILVTILVTEKDNTVKISFRSVGDIAVNKWSNEYFGGGGHKNAAGATCNMSLEEATEKIELLIKEQMQPFYSPNCCLINSNNSKTD